MVEWGGEPISVPDTSALVVDHLGIPIRSIRRGAFGCLGLLLWE